MVPRAEGEGGQAAHKVRRDVGRVELAPVPGDQVALHELGADAARQRARYEGQVQGAPPPRVDDPVEDRG